MVRARALRVLPESRSECRGGERPCPYVSCRFHLLLDVTSDGRLYLTRELDEQDEDSIADALREMPETCALDVADRGASTSRTIADLLGMARRQGVEETVSVALEKIRKGGHDFEEREHPEDFYIRYANCGADELAEIAAELRARGKVKR